MATDAIDVVLFDLGGVLIDLGGVPVMKGLSTIDNDDELWRRWLTCRWVRSFERGECSADDFASGVVDDWELPVGADAFLDSFRKWPSGLLPGADALVRSVQEVVPVGCLSNTNALHWDDFLRIPAVALLDYCFVSFQLGIVKPDRELFDRVAELLPTPPGRVLFLDDNAINVEGAIEAGFVARHVRGPDEARRELVAAGVLAAD